MKEIKNTQTDETAKVVGVDLQVGLLANSKIVYSYNPNYHNQPSVIVVWQYEQWRDTSLKMKGISANCIDITSRTLLYRDIEIIHPHRLQVMYYHNWGDLIKDERLYGSDDENFLNELINFSKNHPLKNQIEIKLQEA